MSTLWTPGGERPVGASPPPPPPPPAGTPGDDADLTPEQLQARMVELRDQLAATPAEMVVANHCYGLFELAALHLSVEPPNFGAAQLAIDALGALVEGLGGRLGEAESQLNEALTSLRLAFVQVRAGGDPPAAG